MRSRTLFSLPLLALTLVACSKTPAPVVSEAQTDHLAADRIAQVLALQPGVVAPIGSGDFSTRGGRGDEKVSYIDGVPVQAGGRGGAFNSGRPASGDTASLPTMLIRTGQAEVRVDSLEPAIAALEALARRAGGYVGNTAMMGGEERRRSAMLQLRVPSSRFGDLQAGLNGLGKVLSLSVQVQDVGEEYTDAAARLKSKRQAEDRMLELLRTRAGKLSDVVELEQALEQVREEIESTEGRLRYLRNQVGLSTMMVTLSEPGLQMQEPGYHPIRDAFGAAWRNFTGFIASLIAASGWLIPLTVLLFLGARLALGLWRRRAVVKG